MSVEIGETSPRGRTLLLHYNSGGVPRGLLYSLDQKEETRWDRRLFLLAAFDNGSGSGTAPSYHKPGADFNYDAVRVVSAGPDRVTVPEDLDRGRYRVCAMEDLRQPRHCAEFRL